ncbi:GUN4 domain-containing protein [Microcoleus sp. herbarium8]|uniref:GUN4 domain-containing protein n=1 Tax=Microcoleus sp. herbarium8 TaxID=3055436 RepID=UPI002FCEA335
MWIFILIVLAVVVYFVVSQASSSNQASRTQSSKASSQNYTNQVDYSNLEVISLDTSVSIHYNYTHLRDLLAEGKWKEADKETGRLMLAVGYLTAEKKIRNGEWTHADPESNRLDFLHSMYFPCPDLCTIDRLWLKYRNGRFGFSVQKRIMSELGEDTISFLCTSNSSYQESQKKRELRKSFERRIGWYTPDREDSAGRMTLGLKIYNDLTFSMQAPHGHLPTANYCWEGSSYSPRDGGSFETQPLADCHTLVYVLNRLSICRIAL